MADKRLIDANALLRRFQKRREDFASAWRTFKAIPDTAKIQYHEMLESAIIVEDADTVDAVEVVYGRWEDEYGGAFSNPRYRCSICKEKALYRHEQTVLGNWQAVQALTSNCPSCGAKMDGGADHV